MKGTDLLALPPGIRLLSVERRGYAASANALTALARPGLPPCEREACPLRGMLAPRVHDTVAAMKTAIEIARRKEATGELPPLGYLFHVRIAARIAVPDPGLARALARGEAPEIWDALRPLAGEERLEGISLPYGTILFAGSGVGGTYYERQMASFPAIDVARPSGLE